MTNSPAYRPASSFSPEAVEEAKTDAGLRCMSDLMIVFSRTDRHVPMIAIVALSQRYPISFETFELLLNALVANELVGYCLNRDKIEDSTMFGTDKLRMVMGCKGAGVPD